MKLGAVLMTRLPGLQSDKWYRLEDLMTAQEVPRRGNVFYAQSWLLTHMMRFQEPYRGKFEAFAAALLNGNSPETALASVYQTDIEQLERDLKKYFRDRKIGYTVVPWQIQEPEILEVKVFSSAESQELDKQIILEFAESPDPHQNH